MTKTPRTARVYKGKNGFTSTFTKIKVNEGTKWVRSGGTSKTVKTKRK